VVYVGLTKLIGKRWDEHLSAVNAKRRYDLKKAAAQVSQEL
jgi:hypothetical protein